MAVVEHKVGLHDNLQATTRSVQPCLDACRVTGDSGVSRDPCILVTASISEGVILRKSQNPRLVLLDGLHPHRPCCKPACSR